MGSNHFELAKIFKPKPEPKGIKGLIIKICDWAIRYNEKQTNWKLFAIIISTSLLVIFLIFVIFNIFISVSCSSKVCDIPGYIDSQNYDQDCLANFFPSECSEFRKDFDFFNYKFNTVILMRHSYRNEYESSYYCGNNNELLANPKYRKIFNKLDIQHCKVRG